MKVRYRTSDNTVTGFNWEGAVNAGEAVEDFDGDIPSMRCDFFKRSGKGVYQEKSQAEKDAITNAENSGADSLRAKIKTSLSLSDAEAKILVK